MYIGVSCIVLFCDAVLSVIGSQVAVIVAFLLSFFYESMFVLYCLFVQICDNYQDFS